MKDCEWIQSQLDDIVDGDLSAEVRAEVQAHLNDCADCRGELESLHALLGAARALPKRIEPPRDLWTAIEPELRGGVIRFPDWRRHVRTALFAAAVAAAVVTAVSLGLDRMPAAHDSAPRVAYDVVEEPFQTDRAVLREAYLARADRLDPELRSVVETNLTIIEASLAEIHRAMQLSPENPRWEQMLHTACLSEVTLLQQVVYNGLEG